MDPTTMDSTALASALEAAEATQEPADEAAPTAEAQTETPEASEEDAEKADLRSKLATMEKRLRDKDSFIGKQKNELDRVQAKLKTLTVPDKPTSDDFTMDPVEANERLDAHRKAKEEKQQLEQQQQLLEHMENNRSVVMDSIPEFVDLLPDVAKVLTEDDGLAVELVSQFLSNPFYADPVALIQMAKRAKTRGEAAQLRDENTQLKEQIESLKKKPGNVLDKVDRATRSGPTVTSKAGRSAPKNEGAITNPAQLAAMTYDQLAKALQDSNEE